MGLFTVFGCVEWTELTRSVCDLVQTSACYFFCPWYWSVDGSILLSLVFGSGLNDSLWIFPYNFFYGYMTFSCCSE